MTKGGKLHEKTSDSAKKKTTRKTNLKVKVLRTTKSRSSKKSGTKVVVEQPEPKKVAHTRVLQVDKESLHKSDNEDKKTVEKPKISKERARILYEKAERDKLFIIRAGVTLVMTVIVLAWIFTLKSTIKVTDNSAIDLSAIKDLKQMTESVSEKIQQINSDLEKVQNFSTSTKQNTEDALAASSSIEIALFESASSTLPLLIEKIKEKNGATSSSMIDANDINALKQRIEELENGNKE